MATPCLTNTPLNGIIHAKPGTIHLAIQDLIGHCFFDLRAGATTVSDGQGRNVPVEGNATQLSFGMEAGNSYQLLVAHERDIEGARALLIEECDAKTPLGILSDAGPVSRFHFVTV